MSKTSVSILLVTDFNSNIMLSSSCCIEKVNIIKVQIFIIWFQQTVPLIHYCWALCFVAIIKTLSLSISSLYEYKWHQHVRYYIKFVTNIDTYIIKHIRHLSYGKKENNLFIYHFVSFSLEHQPQIQMDIDGWNKFNLDPFFYPRSVGTNYGRKLFVVTMISQNAN